MQQRNGLGWLVGSLALTGLLFSACTEETVEPLGDDGDTSSGTSVGGGTSQTGVGGAGGGGEVNYDTEIQTVSGDITWNVTFDDDAKATGATDCSYTRHYEAVEDRSAPWLCPSCEIMFRADVEMTAGEADCFTQISSGPVEASEWIGYGNGVWYRGLGGPMSDQGVVTVETATLTTTNSVLDIEFTPGGFFAFDVAGQFSRGTTIGDPNHGFNPPSTYACGWTKSNLPAYTGNYSVVVGQTIPDGLFKDACDETVRLHDLTGTYTMIHMSAIDCPPCRSMAGEEEEFVAEMAAAGVPVQSVTLLAPSLADPLGNTSIPKLNTWISTFGLTTPVLADRGWGLSMFLGAIGDDTGYPSWVIVAPNLEVIEFGTGFGGFAAHKATILAHAE